MAKPETCYAIIDAAAEPEVFNLLAEFEPPASCLYSEPVQPEIAELAPYLVEATEDVKNWLNQRETPWGMYVYTQATMRELRQHLRKYLMVMIPGQEKPVFWRFYDPRNVWGILGTFDNWRLHVFLGPITQLKTVLWGEETASRFERERRNYPENAKLGGKLMKFTDSEMLMLSQQKIALLTAKMALFFIHATERYQTPKVHVPIDELVEQTIYNPKILSLKYFTTNLCNEKTWEFYFEYAKKVIDVCHEHDINHDKPIGLFCYLLAFHEIYSVELIPSEWHVILSTPNARDFYKIEKLSMTLMDTIPNFYRHV
ncbi:MAG: DUF4123 domain-containing protein [Providencia sp.]|uniref:DUF4123 domain-containing protein n=1 Tax=Providencia sp. TaxID=589 RepID=UPI001B4AC2AB|nr:DUF4123 domain-containing protein [Providencia sp.]MBP6082018.1 DUF4123 domain-containing protein [Providencia sp.]